VSYRLLFLFFGYKAHFLDRHFWFHSGAIVCTLILQYSISIVLVGSHQAVTDLARASFRTLFNPSLSIGKTGEYSSCRISLYCSFTRTCFHQHPLLLSHFKLAVNIIAASRKGSTPPVTFKQKTSFQLASQFFHTFSVFITSSQFIHASLLFLFLR
jgi:hypothetical protein